MRHLEQAADPCGAQLAIVTCGLTMPQERQVPHRHPQVLSGWRMPWRHLLWRLHLSEGEALNRWGRSPSVARQCLGAGHQRRVQADRPIRMPLVKDPMAEH